MPFTFECLKKLFMNIHILEDFSPKGLLVVQGLNSRWFLSKLKRNLKPEQLFLSFNTTLIPLNWWFSDEGAHKELWKSVGESNQSLKRF